MINGNNGPNVGSSIGQQFIACETGTLNQIELNIAGFTSTSTMKIEIYNSSTGWSNLMWQVDNIPINSSGNIIIDLTTGSGMSLNVVQNQTYSMRIWNTGNDVFTLGNQFSTTDSYTNGFDLKHSGAISNWSPNFLDYYFRIGFNNSTLSTTFNDFEYSNLKIYPNPTSNYIYFNKLESQFIEIYNLLGKKITQKEIVNKSINISNLKPGVYFLKFLLNNKFVTKKIIKK